MTGLLGPNGASQRNRQLPSETVSILHGLFRTDVRGSQGYVTDPQAYPWAIKGIQGAPKSGAIDTFKHDGVPIGHAQVEFTI